MLPPASDATNNADHLRRIVEKQPACLMRVGLDGLILAANDAALALLGADRSTKVLGSFLTKWVEPSHQLGWLTFAQSAAVGASQSLECHITDASGTKRNIVFDAVPMADHPDGIVSLLLGTRDATALRRVEAALSACETTRETLVAAAQQPPQPDDGRLQQLELLLKQGRTHLQKLRVDLDGTIQERDRLTARVAELEAADGCRQAAHAEEEKARAEQHQHEMESLRAQVQDASTKRTEISARLEVLEAEHDDLRAEEVKLRQALAAVQHQQGLAGPKFDQLTAENQELQARLAELEEVKQLESAQRQSELDMLRTELREIAAERDRLGSIQVHLEEMLGAAAAHDRSRQQELADRHVEIRSLSEILKQAEPLAVAGRLATQVADELLASLTAMDARAAGLLAQCPVDSASRDGVEQLRVDAERAASLARQLHRARHIAKAKDHQ